MRIDKYRISHHAAKRMAQRNLSVSDIALVLRLGRKEHRTGVRFFFFGERDVPRGRELDLRRLAGTTVVAADERILTVYRNERAISRIKRKPKWRWLAPWERRSKPEACCG
jgi:hypothetical protein